MKEVTPITIWVKKEPLDLKRYNGSTLICKRLGTGQLHEVAAPVMTELDHEVWEEIHAIRGRTEHRVGKIYIEVEPESKNF